MKRRLWFLLHDLEKLLLLLLFLLFVCFFLAQAVMTTEKGRSWLSATDRLEGRLIYPLPVK